MPICGQINSLSAYREGHFVAHPYVGELRSLRC